jgi:hypothetical protein
MNDSDARIARLLQAAATLYTSGHVREDAVHVAMKLEEHVLHVDSDVFAAEK